MSQNLKLEHLFKRCDTRGTGFIDQKEFRDLCRGFEIENNDADIIFDDLDHDGDGRISFNDFAFGFRDFLTPGARRGSIQLGLTSPSTPAGMVSRQPSFRYSNDDADDGLPEEFDVETQEKQRVMEKKHQEAKEAWKNFADHLGKEDVKKFLSVRWAKLTRSNVSQF